MCLPRKSYRGGLGFPFSYPSNLFGMDVSPSLFSSRISFLRMSGCWSCSPSQNKWENVYTYAACASLTNSFLGVSLSFYALLLFIAEQKDIDSICSQAIASIIAFQVFSKSWLMFVKSRQLQRLINDLNGSLHRHFVSSDKDREIVRRCYVYDLRLAIFFWVFSTFLTVANIMRPIIVTMSGSGIQLNERGERIGEFPSKYPFELATTSFWYGFWFAQQAMVVLPGSVASWVSDSMICALLYYMCGYFEIIKNKVKEGGSDLDLKKIARYHLRIVRFSKEMIAAFGPLIVIQLLLAAITICCLLFQFFSVSGGLVQYFRPLAYLILKFIQMFIMCWHGQLLLDKSTEIGEELYFCPWYNQSKIDTADLKILMILTRVPVRVSYGAIFQLSAGAFMQILNAAYGYFAMMSKMKQ